MSTSATLPVELVPALNLASDSDNYVLALFKYVLKRNEVNKAELDYWTGHFRSHPDPVSLFNLFAQSEECQKILAEQKPLAQQGFPAGHFYSPIVSVREVSSHQERIFSRTSAMGIDWRLDVQESSFEQIARHAHLLPFDDERSPVRWRYHYSNTSYGFGDALVYWGILAKYKPRRIVEIGSGYTSALALDAIEWHGLKTKCTFVDPYPKLLRDVCGDIDRPHRVLECQVQEIDLGVVDELSAGDILFIDSSHVVKTGSDVHFEITQLLPRLKPGVIVHFHDIFFPFEYPIEWVLNDKKSWNEIYFIHSFLMYNNRFSVILCNDFYAKNCRESVKRLIPAVADRFLLNPGGGLWLQVNADLE